MTSFCHAMIDSTWFVFSDSISFETAKTVTFHTQIMGTTRIGDYSDITAKMADFAVDLKEFTRSEHFSAERKLLNNFKPLLGHFR